jgi:hypothetical protein
LAMAGSFSGMRPPEGSCSCCFPRDKHVQT